MRQVCVDKFNVSCSDTGPGTAVQPYCSIVKGGTAATAGDTVQVAAGSYTGMVTIANSGTSTDPITFTPAPGAAVTVTGGVNGFKTIGKSYVTIAGFTVTATSGAGFNISNGSHVTIDGNTVTYAGQPVSGQIANGIKLAGTTDSVISDNIVEHNSDHGIYLAAATSGIVVERNKANYNARQYERAAIGILAIGTNTSILDNVTHDNEDTGLQFGTGGNNGLASGNVVYNNGDHGIDNQNVTGGKVIGNTVYHNCTSGINVEGTSGSYTVANNIAFDNAVFAAYNGISCDRRGGNIGVWDSASATTTANHNLVWLTTTGKQYSWAGTTYNTLGALQAASGQEANGIWSNPLVVSAAAWNLQLTSASPAIDSANSGVAGARATDHLGNPRVDVAAKANTGAGPRLYDDRGAYKYQAGPPPVTPPTAALTLSPAAGTVPAAMTANASASTPGTNAISTYTFNFGDGTTVGPQAGSSASHTYTAAGSYTVTVTVNDIATSSDTETAGVTVSSGAGTEFVYNPGFETNNIGWNSTPSGSTTLTRVAGGHSGSWAAETANTSASSVSCTLNDSPNWVATTAAGTVTGSVWVRATTARTIKIKLTEYSSGTNIGSASAQLTLGTSWQLLTVSYAVTSPGSMIDLNIYTNSTPTGQCFQADDASLLQTSGSLAKILTNQPGSTVGVVN